MAASRSNTLVLTSLVSLVLCGCGGTSPTNSTLVDPQNPQGVKQPANESSAAPTEAVQPSSPASDERLASGGSWAPNDPSAAGTDTGPDKPKRHFCQHASKNGVVPNAGPCPTPSGDLTKTPEKDRQLSAEELQYRTRISALVLDPAAIKKEFKDRPEAAPAYELARKHPDVLRRLFCYCGCDLADGHTTLLDCYTARDRHGATCSECIDETFLAQKLYENGAHMARIQQIVDEQFCGKYPFPPAERSETYKRYLANRLYTDSTDPICGDNYSR